MVAALKRAVRLRQTLRARDVRIEASGCAKSPPTLAVPPPPVSRGLTARELIRMAQAARRRSE